MSFDVSRWAWEISVEATTKLVLLALADHADKDGLCWPSVGRLSSRTGLSDRTVQRAIADLIASGVVIRTGKNGTLPRYRLRAETPDTASGVKLLQTPDTASGVQGVNPRHADGGPPTQCQGTPDTVSPEPISKPINEPAKQCTLGHRSRAASFDEWWTCYPKKVGRGAAERAYGNAIKRGADPEQLFRAVQRQPWPENPKFVPHPATWLNGKRWMDEDSPSSSVTKVGTSASSNMPALGDLPENWLQLADRLPDGTAKTERDRGGVIRPVTGGCYLDVTAREVCQAAGIADERWRGDWPTLVSWIRDGIDLDGIVIPTIRRIAARPTYTGARTLKFFDAAVREAPRR